MAPAPTQIRDKHGFVCEPIGTAARPALHFIAAEIRVMENVMLTARNLRYAGLFGTRPGHKVPFEKSAAAGEIS
jgi:hypothetical protein